MRFVGIDKAVQKSRRTPTKPSTVQDEEVKDAVKLANILRDTLQRLSDLEARTGREPLEVEVATGISGALVTISHNFSGPVRWWLTCWTRPVSQGAYPTTAPILVQDATSTADTLVLKSYVAGRAVLRIEPSSGTMEP